MEVSAAERAGAWLALAFAAGIIVISVDLLTGGRLLGGPGDPGEEAAEDGAGGD
jgi:hypothetical protein